MLLYEWNGMKVSECYIGILSMIGGMMVYDSSSLVEEQSIGMRTKSFSFWWR